MQVVSLTINDNTIGTNSGNVISGKISLWAQKKTKDYVKRKISKLTTSYLIPDCFKKGIIFEGKLIV